MNVQEKINLLDGLAKVIREGVIDGKGKKQVLDIIETMIEELIVGDEIDG